MSEIDLPPMDGRCVSRASVSQPTSLTRSRTVTVSASGVRLPLRRLFILQRQNCRDWCFLVHYSLQFTAHYSLHCSSLFHCRSRRRPVQDLGYVPVESPMLQVHLFCHQRHFFACTSPYIFSNRDTEEATSDALFSVLSSTLIPAAFRFFADMLPIGLSS